MTISNTDTFTFLAQSIAREICTWIWWFQKCSDIRLVTLCTYVSFVWQGRNMQRNLGQVVWRTKTLTISFALVIVLVYFSYTFECRSGAESIATNCSTGEWQVVMRGRINCLPSQTRSSWNLSPLPYSTASNRLVLWRILIPASRPALHRSA